MKDSEVRAAEYAAIAEYGAKMSAKERVLAAYPDARAAYYYDGAVAIISNSIRKQDFGSGYVGWGQSTAQKSRADAEAEAWEDAASKLPAEGAKMDTQTAELNKAADLLSRAASRLADTVGGCIPLRNEIRAWLTQHCAALRDDNPTVSGDDNKEAKHGN